MISLTEDDIPNYSNTIYKEDQSLRDNHDRESAKLKTRNQKTLERSIERFQKPERKIGGKVGGHCYDEVGEPKARVLRIKGVERQQEVKRQAAVKEEHQRCNKTSKRMSTAEKSISHENKRSHCEVGSQSEAEDEIRRDVFINPMM